MNPRFLAVPFALWLAAAPGASAQKQKNAPAPKNSVKAAAKERNAAKGLPKAQQQQRLLERFNTMPPEQQQRVLANMAPERRRQFEQRMEQYRRMSPEQKKQIASQLEQLPPEKRQAAVGVFRRINQLPEDRKVAVRNEIRRLNRMSEDKRAARLEGKDFKKSYSPEEQSMISEMTGMLSAN